MEKDVLSAVIETEKKIQERLRAEKAVSLEGLEKIKQDVEEGIKREEEKLKESYDRAIESGRAGVEGKDAEIVKGAKTAAERLSGIDEETLKGIIMSRLSAIIPREGGLETTDSSGCGL